MLIHSRSIVILLIRIVGLFDSTPSNCELHPGEVVVFCYSIGDLTRHQIELCRRQPAFFTIAMAGVKNAISECQHQFGANRWNCSTLQKPNDSTKILNNPMLKRGFKETAFIQALISASITISVTRTCIKFRNICDPNELSEQTTFIKPLASNNIENATRWKWSGTHRRNIEFGLMYTTIFQQEFTMANGKSRDFPAFVTAHNWNVGKMLILENERIRCKCHGLSGSCELKTCWRVPSHLRTIGTALKGLLKTAVPVQQTNSGGVGKMRLKSKYNNRRVQIDQRFGYVELDQHNDSFGGKRKKSLLHFSSRNLLFYENSPSFCDANFQLGTPSTVGRQCSTNHSGSNSCTNLCCGRGYDFVKRTVIRKCECKFQWCCNVGCELCSNNEWISVCK